MSNGSPCQALFSLWALSPVLGCLVEGALPVATQLSSLIQQNRTRAAAAVVAAAAAAAAEAAGRLTGSKGTDSRHQRRTLT